MKFRSLLTLLWVGIPVLIQAQAFNTFNQRNHPEIDWVESESPHFKFIYGKQLQSFIPQAAVVAESTYVALSKGLNVEFDRKIKIYFSDEDEIVNGAATPFINSYTYIWIGLNDGPDFFTGDKKWFRTVMSHELAHLFHFEAVKTNMGIWGLAFGKGVPRDFAEGYAQYATEVWNAQRGDRWLRSAIFDDKPSFNDNSPYNGRLLYADGYAKLLFISDQYGDSTISKMFAYRDTLLFGFTLPDIYQGFEKTTGEKWKDFEDRRIKHLNIYYNTLASEMDRTDSLKGKKVDTDLQIITNAKVSNNGSKLVISGLKSMEKRYSQTVLFSKDSTGYHFEKVLFNGSMNADLSWSENDEQIYFSMIVRSENGSLENDLFSYDFIKDQLQRLSFGKRLSYPVQESEHVLLAIQNQNGTGNVVRFDLQTGEIQSLTSYTGDVQILHLAMNHAGNQIAYFKNDEKGNRTIELFNLKNQQIKSFTSGLTDDRNPQFSPDDNQLAFNSLRDRVPNIFVLDLKSETIHRATNIFTGAELMSWSVPDSTKNSNWVVKSTEKKEKEFIWLVSDTLHSKNVAISIPENYSSWISASPKQVIAGNFEPNPNLISKPKPYSHVKNVGHFISLGLPYVDDASGDFGLSGFSSWSDPLGKHQLSTFGDLSFTKINLTYGIFSYLNNTQSFSWNVDAYRFPSAFQFYDDNSLLSILSGFSAGITQKVEWPYKPFTQSVIQILNRNFLWQSSLSGIYSTSSTIEFDERWQNDITISWIYKYSLPYIYNDVHPLESHGVSLSVKLGTHSNSNWFGSDAKKLGILDFKWFDVRSLFNEITWYSSFRAQVQLFDPLPFEAVQLVRYDNFSLPIFDGMPLVLWNIQDRVRGYRSFILAEQLYFNTVEVRAPLLPTLSTRILGLISLEKTTVALFSDVAFANKISSGSTNSSIWQWGIGSEIKNKMSVLGLPIVHSLGFGQPYNQLFSKQYDLYYRIQATIPF